MDSRTKNAKRNGFWALLYKVLSLLLPFLARTVIIYTMGTEYLGLSSLFTSILTVLNLSELGIGSAIVFSMYKPVAEKDTEKICALLNFYKKIYRTIGIAIFIVGIAIIPILPNIIKSDIPNDLNLGLLYLIYLINTCVSYWLFAYKNCLIYVHQRDDILSKTTLFANILMNALQITCLLIWKNYYTYAIILPITTVCQNIINAFVARKKYPQYRPEGKLKDADIQDIKRQVFGLSLLKVATASRNSLDSIIISAFLGLNLVAIHSNYFYIISSVGGILVVATNAIAAGVGNSIAAESPQKNYDDMRKINILYMMISGFCAVCIACIYQPFMMLWVGKDLMLPESVVALYVIYFLVEKTVNIEGRYFDAAGLWWNARYKGIIETATNLFLNITLGYFFGLAGIIFSTIFTIVFINFPITTRICFKHYFKMKPHGFYLDQLIVIVLVLIAMCVAYSLCAMIPMSTNLMVGILGIGGRVLICSAAMLSASFALYRFYPIYGESMKWLKIKLFK